MTGLLALALLASGPQAAQAVEVAVLARPIARGERVLPGDFSFEEREPARARDAVSPEDTVGMEAKRNLMAGAVVRPADLVPVRLVRRGNPVTLRIVSGQLTISASGRALSDGGAGDMVRVVTDATSRTLDGVVDSSGTVRIQIP